MIYWKQIVFGSVRVMCPNRKWIGPQIKIWEGAEVAETAMHCRAWVNRARQLYKNISMLFLFPVKTVSLVQASIQNVGPVT